MKEARALHGDKYDYSKVVYIDCYTPVEIICPIHGSFWQRPVEHLDKKRPCGCPYCSFNRKTYKEFIDLANELHNFKYQYNLEYTDEKFIYTDQKIEIICPIHGSFFQRAYNHIYTDERTKVPNGCPKCKTHSLTEIKIEEFLNSLKIKFSIQKAFNGCIYKNPLKFDFYLPDYNLCIEYQGEQHYKSVQYWGGEEAFKKVQIRDQIKKDYCLENEIFLLEVPYDLGSIENIKSYITYVLNNMKEGVFEYDLSDWRSSRGY